MDKRFPDKIVKPADCILAFGIPTSRDDFIKDIQTGDKDFAKTIKGGWFQYKTNIISNLREILAILENIGVTVIHRLTLEDFGKLLNRNTAKVIILFSHWKEEPHHTNLKHAFNGSVEFHDGLKSPDEIIRRIPNNFSNMLDLNVCRSKALAEALKRTRPNCYFRRKIDVFETGNGDEVKLDIMLHFYKILLKHLARTSKTYFNAYMEVIESFSKLFAGLEGRKP
jgi:hypothetical protein